MSNTEGDDRSRRSKRRRLQNYVNSTIDRMKIKVQRVAKDIISHVIGPTVLDDLKNQNTALKEKCSAIKQENDILKQQLDTLIQEKQSSLDFDIDLARNYFKSAMKKLRSADSNISVYLNLDEVGRAVQRLQVLMTQNHKDIRNFEQILTCVIEDCWESFYDDEYTHSGLQALAYEFFGELSLYLALNKRWEDLHWLHFSLIESVRECRDYRDMSDYVEFLTLEFFRALVNEVGTKNITEEDSHVYDASTFLMRDVQNMNDCFLKLEDYYGIDGADVYNRFLYKVPTSIWNMLFWVSRSGVSRSGKTGMYTYIFRARIVRSIAEVRKNLSGKYNIEHIVFDKFIDPCKTLFTRYFEDPTSPPCMLLLFEVLEDEKRIDDVLFRLLMTITPGSFLSRKDYEGNTPYSLALQRRLPELEPLTTEQLERLRPDKAKSTHCFAYDSII